MKKLLPALLGLTFVACNPGASEPLTPEELVPLQSCVADEDCVVVHNGPRTCCGGGGVTNPAAIARGNAHDFPGAFRAPSCGGVECSTIGLVGPTYDAKFFRNKYPVGCRSGLCEVLEVRENTGDMCSGPMSCPSEYRCEPLTNDQGLDYCLFIGTSMGSGA